jgi:hypothetical protein
VHRQLFDWHTKFGEIGPRRKRLGTADVKHNQIKIMVCKNVYHFLCEVNPLSEIKLCNKINVDQERPI